MAHGVELEIAEGDLLHLAVGGMVLDRVFVAAEPVARLEYGWIAIGDARDLVEAAAGEFAEALEVRFEFCPDRGIEMQAQEILQAAVDGPEILPRAVLRQRARRDDRRSAGGGKRAVVVHGAWPPRDFFRDCPNARRLARRDRRRVQEPQAYDTALRQRRLYRRNTASPIGALQANVGWVRAPRCRSMENR